MNVADIIMSLIKSDDIKQEILNKNHKFSLEEQISLIYNSDLELDSKTSILKNIKNNYVMNEDTRIELNIMLDNIYIFYSVIQDPRYVFLFYNEYNEAKLTNSLDLLRGYILEHYEKISLDNINIIDLESTDINNNVIYVIKFNNVGSVISFYSTPENVNYSVTKLERSYVNIPNSIEIGDIITVSNDANKYVVVNTSEIPEKLRGNCSIDDTSITVINKELLSNIQDYKKYIEETLKSRINSFNMNEANTDILQDNSFRVSIIDIKQITK